MSSPSSDTCPSAGHATANVASSGASSSSSSSDGWHEICSVDRIKIDGAHCVDVAGRPIVLFRIAHKQSMPAQGQSRNDDGAESSNGVELPDGSKLFALDRVCYHMGGPLESGAIEDLGSRLRVICPWHRYHIGLEDGEGLYQVSPGVWKSKGARQRVHRIKWVRRAAGSEAATDLQPSNASDTDSDIVIFVRLNNDPAPLASDSYNDPAKYRALQERLGKQRAQGGPAGGVNPHPYLQPYLHLAGGTGTGTAPNGYQRSGHVFAGNRAAASMGGIHIGSRGGFGNGGMSQPKS